MARDTKKPPPPVLKPGSGSNPGVPGSGPGGGQGPGSGSGGGNSGGGGNSPIDRQDPTSPPTTAPPTGYFWYWSSSTGQWELQQDSRKRNPGGETGSGPGATVKSCEEMKGAAPKGFKWQGSYVTNADGSISDTCQLVQDTTTTDESTKEQQRQAASAYLTDLLTQYGLAELIPTIDGLIKEWGTNTSIIVSKLRQTDAYKQRFIGNEYRIKNGYSAITEAEYLSTEDAIKSTMRKYGLTSDYYSRDKLATLIGGDVSPTEVDGRIGQAKKVIDNADPNIKSSLTKLYGASMSDMLGYVLAPETALEVVQRRVNAGYASGVALGQGIDLGVGLAEQVGDLTFGDERTLRSQFAGIGDTARSTARLAGIDNENVSSQDVVRGQFGIDQAAETKVKRLQSRERARFGGQSATISSTLSGSGA